MALLMLLRVGLGRAMLFSVFPLRAIAFQILFLLTAIAIEAVILRQEMKLTPKKALQYATTLNLFTVGLGWFMFVNLVSVFPADPRREVMRFIFFGEWSPTTNVALTVIVLGFLVFFLSFGLKVLGLSQLQFLLMTEQDRKARRDQDEQRYQLGVKRPRRTFGANMAQANAILRANALSYSAMTFVLAVRYLVTRITVF